VFKPCTEADVKYRESLLTIDLGTRADGVLANGYPHYKRFTASTCIYCGWVYSKVASLKSKGHRTCPKKEIHE